MTKTYRATMLTKKGGPEVLETVELPLREPRAGEVRVRIRAAGAGFTDVVMRRGRYPYAPPIPFVPGYDVVGDVEAVGEGVTSLRVGQRVTALTVHGGYAEVIYREAEHFVPVPDGLDDLDVLALPLNYVTAYQMIHRTAKLTPGQSALVTGANGGVGTAMLELLRAHGVRAFGAASRSKHELVRAYGATPIESRGEPIDRQLRALLPGGVDASFDGIGGATTGQCVGATRVGGRVVAYGFTGTAGSDLQTLRGVLALYLRAPLTLRRPTFYGITMMYRRDPRPFREDLGKLFALLAEKKIAPRIGAKVPLLEARRANEMLERGGVEGKVALVA